jgi:hypothetical protein
LGGKGRTVGFCKDKLHRDFGGDFLKFGIKKEYSGKRYEEAFGRYFPGDFL